MPPKKTSTSKAASRQRKPRAATESTKETPVIRQQKPVFGVGTWLALVLLAGLLTLGIFLNQKKASTPAEETPTKESVSLFAVTDGTPSGIEVKPAEGDAVRVVRNAENVWALELPFETEADQGLSEAAASQISALQIVNSVDGDPAIFGLDHPAYIIAIEFASGKKHILEIGLSTPSNSGYYVRVDNDKMVIIDLNGIESLLRLQAFPPYLNTPTPTPTAVPPTETPTPAPPTETITPEASVTSTP